jgi:hypothetical protein
MVADNSYTSDRIMQGMCKVLRQLLSWAYAAGGGAVYGCMTWVCGCRLFCAAGVHQGQVQDWRLTMSASPALVYNAVIDLRSAPGLQGAV